MLKDSLKQVFLSVSLACGLAAAALVTDASAASNRSAAVERLGRVMTQMLPVLERECARHRSDLKCQFSVRIDYNAGKEANAFLLRDRYGDPLLLFRIRLLMEIQNDHELAFVVAHEAAHHLLDHPAGRVQYLGAASARASLEGSKQRELAADLLGGKLLRRSGFSMRKGIAYLKRISAQGQASSNSHPSIEKRVKNLVGR